MSSIKIDEGEEFDLLDTPMNQKKKTKVVNIKSLVGCNNIMGVIGHGHFIELGRAVF